MTSLRTSLDGLYWSTKSTRSLTLRSGMQVIDMDYKGLFIFINPCFNKRDLLHVWPWQNHSGQLEQGIHLAMSWQCGNALIQVIHVVGLGVLISFIPYYIRAYATNRVGTAYGNVVNFTSTNILPSVITKPVTFVNGIAKSGGNVLSDGGAFITAKGVVYDTLPSPTLANGYTINGSDTGSFISELGLISLIPYYIRAYATNSVGTAYGNQVTFTAPLAVGNIFGGGTVFYLDSSGQHGLVCAPSDQGIFEWGCFGTDIVGTSTAFGTGQANTNLILAGCSTRPIAASVCDDLVLNGYSDWYLPSRDELQLMYSNLRVQGIGGFSNTWYWSSSQYDPYHAWSMNFTNGFVYGSNKGNTVQVRAVRAF